MQRINLNRPRLPRDREVRACQQCRIRKIRCGREKPHCQRCLEHNRPCLYTTKPPKELERVKAITAKDISTQPGQPTTNSSNAGDQNIWPNQVGHLTSSAGPQVRYFSSASWVSTLEDWEQASSSVAEDVSSPVPSWSLGQTPLGQVEVPTEQIERLVSFGEVDRLVRWYSDFCHFWYPIVDLSETMASLHNLRHRRPCSPGSLALVAAICYIASCSTEASGDISTFRFAPSAWRDMAQGFLARSGYPSRPNPVSIRAAFLLALRNMNEFPSHTDPAPICVLVRAAQFLGLHREPLTLHLSSDDADLCRVLWWSVQSLDVGYSLAQALPTLTHPTNSDVQMISSEGRLDRRMLNTIVLVNTTLCQVFEGIYGVQQPTRAVLQRLDEEVEKVCASEVQLPDLPDLSAVERFISFSRNCCCWKLKFVLHQPYLRSAQWPQGSRSKALDACKNYIDDFTAGMSRPPFAPYRWILNHFNVFHACAILLQDLIQYARSPESSDLRRVVESCFFTFFKEADPIWEKLDALRSKAWAANEWQTTDQQDVDWGNVYMSLSDWDPLFASFICHSAFAPAGDFCAG